MYCMAIKIFLERTGKELELDETQYKTPKEVLKHLNESINAVIVTINSEVVLEDHQLEDGDQMNILSVVSGG